MGLGGLPHNGMMMKLDLVICSVVLAWLSLEAMALAQLKAAPAFSKAGLSPSP